MSEKKLARNVFSVIVNYHTSSPKDRERPGYHEMSKPTVHFNDYVSLVVMLLMAVALVTGQADASADGADRPAPVAPIAALDDRINIDFDGHLGDAALKVTIAIATDPSLIRGENE
jgi:hypothetical protein